MVLSASQKIGRPLDSATRYKEEMEEAGFVDITEYIDLWPINKWPKDAKYKELGKFAFSMGMDMTEGS
jgi:hypothetical protein